MAAPGLFFEPSLRIKQQQSSDNSSGPGRIWPPSPPALPDLIVCMLHVMCPLADSIYSLFSHVRAPSVTLFIRFFLISIFQHWGWDYYRFFFPHSSIYQPWYSSQGSKLPLRLLLLLLFCNWWQSFDICDRIKSGEREDIKIPDGGRTGGPRGVLQGSQRLVFLKLLA
jgi:hypothetical protein